MTARLEPLPAAAGPIGRDNALEGLRGCAALTVLYAHLTSHGPYLDPVFAPPKFLWRIEASVMAVMLFFVLSGYVIGLTNQEPATANRILTYLRRRALRLLPIYFAAILLGWLARPGPSLRDLFGNILFLQNNTPDNPFHVALLSGNPNLWSLHYEAIYYLFFIGVWCFRPSASILTLSAFALGACGAVMPGMSLFIAWLACGFIFWIAGLMVSWRLRRDPMSEFGPWPTALLLCVATWRVHALASIAARAGLQVNWVPGALFTYLDSLPVLLWLFLIVARRSTTLRAKLEIFAWLWPVSYLSWRFLRGSFEWSDEIVFDAGLIFAAALARAWTPSLAFWQSLAPVGAISYGLYAFGAPVQYFTLSILPAWSGRWWTYGGRVVLSLSITFALAWLFERVLQPRLRARLPKSSNGSWSLSLKKS